MNRGIGIVLIVGGLGLAALGLLVWIGALNWFGRLPGDIRYESDSTRIWLPITSMIIVSIVLTVIVNLVSRWR